MFGMTRIARDNLAEGYKARFSPDPDTDGYRFNTSAHGEGAYCSTEQYLACVQAFESFLVSRSRLMWWWMIGLFLLCIAGMAALVWLDDRTLFEQLDGLVDRLPPALGGALFVLPLPVFLVQGWRLYRRPAEELTVSSGSIQRRRPTREVMDQRIKGMSGSMLGAGVSIGLLGSALLMFDETYVEMPGGWVAVFPALLLGFVYLIVRKRRVHREEAALIAKHSAEHSHASKKPRSAG